MSSLSDALENLLIDHVLRNIAYPTPTGIWVALFTTPPSEAGPGTEVTGGGYARVQVGPSLTAWTATQGGTSGPSTGTGGLAANAADVFFPAPTGTWGTVTHMALFDAPTGGRMLMQTALAAPRTVNGGDQPPKFAAGAITVMLA